MMLRGNLKKGILVAITCVLISSTISPSVFAAEPHEDPETAKQVFSAISLFRYYSTSLASVLKREPAEVEARLEKMPFANVPKSLKGVTNNFTVPSIDIAYLVVDIHQELVALRTLMEQFRFEEALELANRTSIKLIQADSKLGQIEMATKTTGRILGVPSAPEDSTLRKSYNELLEVIAKIRGLLDLYEDLVANLLREYEDLVANLLRENGELLSPTELTLKVEPRVAFVGDNIHLEGVLTSKGKPLAGREIDILVNGSQYVTAKTRLGGYYEGKLQVPYRYIPEMELQALYYPREKDIGLYISSLSPVIRLQVLFYEAELTVTVEDKAYPGLETIVSARFDYGQSPPLKEREVEIYLDDALITEVRTGEEFSQKIKLDPEIDVGEHIITVSAAADERYAPVVASVILNVTKALPILDINLPGIAMIPGSIGLGGKLYSEVGPLSEALVKMGLGKSQVEVVSSENGTFDAEIKMGMGFSLIGSQNLAIQVIPQEPWHATLTTTRNIVIINTVNCGGILILLVFLGIYLPGRLRRRIGAYSLRRARPAVATAQPEPTPVYSESVLTPALPKEGIETSKEPRNRIFSWYRLVVRLIQGITKVLMKPQQTLREFSGETSRLLGPAAKYFTELTKTVERLLYSPYRPTKRDAERSKELSHNIEEGLKDESI